MTRHRGLLLGPPHTYLVRFTTALDAPLLADQALAGALLPLIERIRIVFDLQLYALAIQPSALSLVLRHRDRVVDSPTRLGERWRSLGGRALDPERLGQRFTSLSGCMQTLGQMSSRQVNEHRGGRGSCWGGRYAACLLADDAALAVAVSHVEGATDTVRSSLGEHSRDSSFHLAALPLVELHDGAVLPRDQTPFGIQPSPPEQNQDLLTRFDQAISADDRLRYRQAVAKAWCLGRPESLSDALARLGRPSGRGRSRRARELDDELGLCGVWG